LNLLLKEPAENVEEQLDSPLQVHRENLANAILDFQSIISSYPQFKEFLEYTLVSNTTDLNHTIKLRKAMVNDLGIKIIFTGKNSLTSNLVTNKTMRVLQCRIVSQFFI